MSNTGVATAWRRDGAALLGGGLLWQPFLAAEKLAAPHSGSLGWYADQGGFVIASAVLLVGFVQLARSRVADSGRVTRAASRALVAAWALVTLGGVVQVAGAGGASDAITGVGGLLTYPTALAVGIGAARARVLPGRLRWVVLVQALFMIVGILLPAMVLNQDPSWAVEAIWQLGWAAVGLTLLRAARGSARGSRSGIAPARAAAR